MNISSEKNKNKKFGFKRKIYRKVGAAAFAILSLLGIGVASKTSEKIKIKGGTGNKSKRFLKNRKVEAQEQEQMANTVHAQVNQELEQVTSQQQTQEQGQTMTMIVKGVAIVMWLGVMGLFGASLFFNAPFPLGNAVMGALPGEPHTIELSLSSSLEQDKIEVGKEIPVDLMLVSGLVEVSSVKAEIKYDPSQFELKKIDYKDSLFPVTVKNSYDNKSGLAVIQRKVKDQDNLPKAGQDKLLATLVFKAKPYIGSADIKIADRAAHPGIDTQGTWVYGKNGKSNLLAKTSDLDINLIPKTDSKQLAEVIQLSQDIDFDADFQEWGQALSYVGFSNQSQGYEVTPYDLIEGSNENKQDFSLNYSLAAGQGKLYFALLLNDNSLTLGDKLEIKLGETSTEFLIKNMQTKNNKGIVKQFDDYYLGEIKVDLVKDFDKDKIAFDLIYYDKDEDNSYSVNKFSR